MDSSTGPGAGSARPGANRSDATSTGGLPDAGDTAPVTSVTPPHGVRPPLRHAAGGAVPALAAAGRPPAAAGRRSSRIAAVAAGAVLLLIAVVSVAYAIGGSTGRPTSQQRVAAAGQALKPAGTTGAVPTAVGTTAASTPAATAVAPTTSAATKASAAPPRPEVTARAAKKARTATTSSARSTSTALPVGSFQLRNLVTGKCVRLAEDAPVLQKCRGGERPWRLERTRKVGSVQLYRLRESATPRGCLDLPDFGVVAEATALGTFSCTTPAVRDNQEFRVYLKRYGKHSHAFALINWKNQMCIDVGGHAIDGSDRKPGSNLTMYRCQDKVFNWDDHLWMFDV